MICTIKHHHRQNRVGLAIYFFLESAATQACFKKWGLWGYCCIKTPCHCTADVNTDMASRLLDKFASFGSGKKKRRKLESIFGIPPKNTTTWMYVEVSATMISIEEIPSKALLYLIPAKLTHALYVKPSTLGTQSSPFPQVSLF